MKLSMFLILFGAVICLGVFAFYKKNTVVVQQNSNSRKTTMQINGKNYIVELAITPQQKTLGLSYRTEIGSDGMLFVLNKTPTQQFWMKDMKFDLDFIWILDGKVSEITRNVPKPQSPDQQLPIYSPQQPAEMMLEVNAGFADRENIKVGDEVKVDIVAE